MAIVKMQRISICALCQYSKEILETLQRMGVMEIENTAVEDSVFYKTDGSVYKSNYIRWASLMAQAADVICEYVGEKKGLFTSLKGRIPLSVKDYENAIQRNCEALDLAYMLTKYKKEISKNKAEIISFKSRIEALTPWKKLNVPMSLRGTKYSKFIIGSFSENLSEEDINMKIAEASSEIQLYNVEVVSADSNQTCVFIICHKSVYNELFNSLRKMGLIVPTLNIENSPHKEIKALINKIEEREKSIKDSERAIISCKNKLSLLRFFEDYYVIKAELYSQLDNISYSPHTFVMTGYVPESIGLKLKALLLKRFGAEAELEDATDENSPVLLKNNPIFSPTEKVLFSYSAPNPFELDPTAVMAFFYYMFFGMMFSDAGYGLVMSIACGIALVRFRNMESGLRKSIKMFFYCGLSTVFWGLMFGSFFGDALSVIFKTFIGSPAPIIPGITSPIWFNPTVGSGPSTLLMFSFLFGIIHLFAGLILQGANHIRHGKLLNAVYDDLSWILLISGAVFVLLSTDMLSGMMNGFRLSPIFLTVGAIMAIVGAVIIFVFSGRESKNPLKRLLKGAYNLYGVTGYLSDILSYSRLLALGLATGVIAGVFNQLGSMPGNSPLGVVFFVAVFVIGHSLNIGINALGAYVHTNRLQFVEFFGKFYTGGGREFKPYTENTKYYTIREDI